MNKKIYRKNFEIRKTALHMATPVIYDAIVYQPKTVGKIILKELIWVQENYANTGAYVLVHELRQLIEETIRAIEKKPEFIRKIHKKTEQYSTEYFNYAKSVLKMNLSTLSNNQLLKVLNKLNECYKKAHGYAITTTWFVDSDGEDFSQLIIKKIQFIIKKQNLNLNYAEVFSLLTTPERLSLAAKEEIESLKILKIIKSNTTSRKVFKQKILKKIEKDIDKLDKKIKNKIISHYNKWRWFSYTYIGPAYDLDFYLSAWSGLLRQNINPEKYIKKLENQGKKVRKRKREIIKKLKLNSEDKRIFEIASEIIYLKAYRKDGMYFGQYVANNLHKEMAKRLGLSLKQVRFMSEWEYKKALKENYFSKEILNKRIKFCVYYQKREKGCIYEGQKARRFLSKLKFENKKIRKTRQMKGTCACPGNSKGIVRVINEPEEMSKMKKGNIMVSHTTFPALVPAMKKASALVTDDGGITCHAAIVSRELKIPCIVGTKIGTKVLKDGDRVEVNANKGIVRKIN